MAAASTPEGRIKAVFKKQYRMLAALFPSNGETMVNRACAVACSLVKTGPLSGANPEAVAAKVIACHHLGLEVGDQASLVPYGQDVQLIVGPRGLIALAFRSGFVKSIVGRSVFEADTFDYDLGDQPFIRHKKAPVGRRAGVITHAYSIIETTTGGIIREVLTAEDIEFYRSFSKAKSGPWIDNFEGMCRKTVLKRTLEFVPRSPLMAAALKDNEVGGYEIPDDMWEEAKKRAGLGADEFLATPQTVGAAPASDTNGAAS